MPTSPSIARHGLRARSWSARLACTAAILLTSLGASADGPPAGVEPEAWAGIQEQIEAERHKITESDRPGRLYRADNPTQRFTAHFGNEDVMLSTRDRGVPAWQLGLRLTAWGAAHNLQPVDPAGAYSEDNRVEYRRGPLTEWYVNTTMGLEQGFTIDAPPADDINELVLEMTLASELTPELAGGGTAVTFKHEPTGSTLTYSGLAAWDAVGDALDTRMELFGGGTRLRLVISVTDAAWPITVDPIFTQVAKLLPTPDLDTMNAYFGRSVAVDKELIIVGIDDHVHGEDSGAAHVFRRDQGGPSAWDHVAKLTASDGAAYDYFGTSLAISGDTVIVGADWDDDNGSKSGSAYVFQRNQGGQDVWGQLAKIIPDDGMAGDSFGFSVSIGGDTAIIGAHLDDINGLDSGSAYVFQRDQGGPNSWGPVAKISADDGQPGDYFGTSIDISRDTAIVAAALDDNNGADSGSAYIFRRDQGGPDAWGQVARITASDGSAEDLVGAVAISGDTAIIGTGLDDDNGSDSGSAYIFSRDHGGPDAWGQVAKISATDAESHDEFGYAVSISGNTAIVGAPKSGSLGDESGGLMSTSSATLFSPTISKPATPRGGR